MKELKHPRNTCAYCLTLKREELRCLFCLQEKRTMSDQFSFQQFFQKQMIEKKAKVSSVEEETKETQR